MLEMLSFSLTAVSAYALGSLSQGGPVKSERVRPWLMVACVGGLICGFAMALFGAG